MTVSGTLPTSKRLRHWSKGMDELRNLKISLCADYVDLRDQTDQIAV